MFDLEDNLVNVIRKLHLAYTTDAAEYVRIAAEEARYHNDDDVSYFRGRADGLFRARSTLELELEKAGLSDILKGDSNGTLDY